jgi:DNA mismatch repair protein MutL
MISRPFDMTVATEPIAETSSRQPVRLLPPQLINRIAAGEVVERPASVVKELVENALDAGATRIDISAGAGGRNIRIADNGCGMQESDAAMAFYNHATSKIQQVEDLDRIATLGFRGEALASIASISKLTCLTRTNDAPNGIKVIIDERGEPVLSETGCAPGTVMEVIDLFYNTPARLKFLKRPQTELGHIEEVVQFLALSHPDVRFSLQLNEKAVLNTSGSNQIKRTLEELFPLQRENIRLAPVAIEDAVATEGALSLAGFTSEPGTMKSSKRWMMTFVNGRHVRCAILQKAVEAAYESLLPHGRYPLCALFLSMPPQDVDVNVHPSKREVRYLASSRVFGFVKAGLRQALAEQGITLAPTTPFAASPLTMPSVHATDAAPFPAQNALQDQVFHTTPAFQAPQATPRASNAAMPPRFPGAQPVQAALNFYQPNTPTSNLGNDQPDILTSSAMQAIASDNEPGKTQERFKVIGQLFNTYILLETVQGLLVVDQHIASERTFFEALTLNLTGEAPLIQKLLTSQPVAIRPAQRALLQKHQSDFAKLGFLYTLVDDAADTVQLEGYPLIYEGRDRMFGSGGLFENLLAQLEETGEMKLDLDPLIATLSCHSAVRAGDPLTAHEMHTVITRWLACELPWTCPHGRPIAHTIPTTELNRFFHRTSLPTNAF